MKNKVWVRTVILVLVALFPASVAAAVKFDLGLKMGVSQAKLREAYSEPYYEVAYSNKLSRPVFGAFIAFYIDQQIAIQPEIYLLTQGGYFPQEGYMAGPETYVLRYIHIPVLGKFIPILFAGPYIDVFLSARDSWYFDGTDHVLMFDDLNGTVSGLVFGAGVEQRLGKAMGWTP